MAYIPADATWYIAEIVERISVEGDDRTVVHVNICLVRADNPEQAHNKAVALGKRGEIRYANPGGKTVSVAFVGLRELSVVHDPLEDGAELMFEEHVGLQDDEIGALARPRDELSVFRPIVPPEHPDYAAKEVMDELAAMMRGRGSGE